MKQLYFLLYHLSSKHDNGGVQDRYLDHLSCTERCCGSEAQCETLKHQSDGAETFVSCETGWHIKMWVVYHRGILGSRARTHTFMLTELNAVHPLKLAIIKGLQKLEFLDREEEHTLYTYSSVGIRLFKGQDNRSKGKGQQCITSKQIFAWCMWYCVYTVRNMCTTHTRTIQCCNRPLAVARRLKY